LLQYIGIGPEAQFIIPFHGSKKTIYISTKNCHLVLLSKLTQDRANNEALLQLHLISQILCLNDCTSNTSNCGQVGDKAMIADFRIEKQSQAYVTEDILDTFHDENCEYPGGALMVAAVKTPRSAKVKKAVQDWKLLENIERAELEVD
jgi:hypothetical protein